MKSGGSKGRGLILGIWMIAALAANAQTRGQLISVSLIETYTTAQIRAIYASMGLPELVAPVLYGISAYKVTYYTPAATGSDLTIASGLILAPDGGCFFPLFAYHHGTAYYGSDMSDQMGEWFLGVPFAANGYLTIMPDYLGLGETPVSHPHTYLHAASEASASIDMMRAARAFCQQEGIQLNGQVFVTGYSQGGHVALATAREIEAQHSGEFSIAATAAASGPYDLSGLMLDSLLAERPWPGSNFFLGYILTSYQYVYGLWNQPSEILAPPYDVIVPQIFDKANPVLGPLPDTAVRMIQPAVLQAIRTQPQHPFRQLLAANDVYDWTPQAPTRLVYCESDEIVPWQNAQTAYNTFVQRGAPSVSRVSAGTTFGHEACGAPSLILIKLWFDSFRTACTTAGLETPEVYWQVYPVPFDENLTFVPAKPMHEVEITLRDLQGRIQYRHHLDRVAAAMELTPEDLPPGAYLLLIQSREGVHRQVVWQK
ncbi:MAG: alpha/beta fold hydrolase [Bacteroidia bacterium]|nr:alpha/beta fold hydrolase [Bacteroidia bacterium]